MTNLLETAIHASLAAGKRIMEIYENEDFEVEAKGDDSPLTKADLAAQDIILSYLKETDIPVLSEEGNHRPYEERRRWKRLWIVDPLDGTREFIKRNGEFTVNIALVEDQVPGLGVIYVPVSRELYFASKETGAYKTENVTEGSNIQDLLRNSKKLPLEKKLKNYTVVASKSHLSPETQDYIEKLKEKHGAVEVISRGSSLKLCIIAEGSAHCYPRFGPTMEWDTAAGQAICTLSGKTLTDLSTEKEMLYNREILLNFYFIAE